MSGRLLLALVSMCVLQVNAQITGSTNKSGTLLFDADWRFALGDFSGAENSGFNDSNWRLLDLPHDWSIESNIEADHPSGNAGGYFADGTGWYRKSFHVPADWKGRELSVYFGGVYMNGEVFINGKSLGIHPYGYTPFRLNLTPYLHYGDSNVLAVRVDNSKQVNCRWYSGSGIYRHVRLELKNKVHLDPWGVQITTPVISGGKATVRIQSAIVNNDDVERRVRLITTVMGKPHAGRVPKAEKLVTLQPGDTTVIVQNIEVSQPKLWDLASPYLYMLQSEIQEQGRDLDQAVRAFGIRSIKFTAEKGFELNGRMVKLNGGCVHHDNGCLGAAAYDRAEERKVALLKAAGFNAVRTAHNPPSTAFLDACDRLGMLVIDEAFDGWRTGKNKYDYALYFDSWWKRDLDAMVLRDRNHPSIIMWSIGNEIIERKEPEAVETARMLAGEVKAKDSTRPVTSAMTTWDQDWTIFDPLMAAHDVAGYNYQLQRATADHLRVPGRIIVQTESYPRDAYENWELVSSHPYIIGDFVWTAMDYLGESSIGRYYYPGEPEGQHWEREFYPWHGAYCGDIDLMGDRKPISYYRSLLYNDSQKLYLAVREPNPPGGTIKETLWSVWPTWRSWTWPGYEGKNMEVVVYSRYPAVRLYLNDRLIGEKPSGAAAAFKTVFSIPYQKGVLKAVGIQKGQQMLTDVLQTAGPVAGIRLVADRRRMDASGQDLSYVKVELVDKDGVIQPNGDYTLGFEISGPGTIAGLDNANLKDPDPYVGHSRKTWKGKALAVIKSSHQPGTIELRVHAEGLPAATLKIQSQKVTAKPARLSLVTQF